MKKEKPLAMYEGTELNPIKGQVMTTCIVAALDFQGKKRWLEKRATEICNILQSNPENIVYLYDSCQLREDGLYQFYFVSRKSQNSELGLALIADWFFNELTVGQDENGERVVLMDGTIVSR